MPNPMTIREGPLENASGRHNMRDRWFAALGSHRCGGRRLICFHHAGGSAAVFRAWPTALGPEVEVWVIYLPGRGRRFTEPPMTDFDDVAAAAARALALEPSIPCAFFGHSLGALLAFEVARRLWYGGRAAPVHLVVAGMLPPRRMVPRPGDAPSFANAELLRRLKDLGGTSRMVLDNPELMAVHLPTIHADLALCESYRYRPGPPLPCTITAMGGRDDREAPLDVLAGWSEETSAGFNLRAYSGGHFFPDSNQDEVLQDLAAIMEALQQGENR